MAPEALVLTTASGSQAFRMLSADCGSICSCNGMIATKNGAPNDMPPNERFLSCASSRLFLRIYSNKSAIRIFYIYSINLGDIPDWLGDAVGP